MHSPPHDKAAEYRRLAEEARTLAKQISIKDARDKLVKTAEHFETLAHIEDSGVRKTGSLQGSEPERPPPESRSTTADGTAPSGQRSRYFFDTDDGERYIPDKVGLELADLAAAREMACRALRDMAGDDLSCGDRRDFVVRVRDEAGHVVLHAALSVTVEDRSKAWNGDDFDGYV